MTGEIIDFGGVKVRTPDAGRRLTARQWMDLEAALLMDSAGFIAGAAALVSQVEARFTVTETGPRWYAVRTATNRELQACASLTDAKVEHFMPMLTRWRWQAGRKSKIRRPLIPGYLFARIDEDFPAVSEAEGVSGIVKGAAPEPTPIPTHWVDMLKRAQRKGVFDATKPSSHRLRLNRGERVKITGGMFIGWLATLLEDIGADKKEVRVELHGLGGGKMPLPVDQLGKVA